jgi:23S rRNA (pseudouridine1915-N3)-methyltransferase
MRLVLASVSQRGAGRGGKSKLPATDALVDEYLGRLSSGGGKWLQAEARVFPTGEALLQAARKAKSTTVLLDSRGKFMTSQQFAAWLGTKRDGSVQEIWLCVGPADGWTAEALAGADLQLGLGPMTLAHELARVVAAEQIYRAWAILEGHPYHRGH